MSKLRLLGIIIALCSLTPIIQAQTLPTDGSYVRIVSARMPNRPLYGSTTSNIFWKAQSSTPQSYQINLVVGTTSQYYFNVSGTKNLGTNGNNGILKATSGETNSSDKWNLTYDATIAGVDYYIVNSVFNTSRYLNFRVSDSTVISTTTAPPGVSTDDAGVTDRDYYRIGFIKIENSEKYALSQALTNVTTFLDNVSEGANPGQFLADDINALKEALTYTQDIYNEPTSTSSDYTTALQDLKAMLELVKHTIIVPQVSSELNEHWYFLKGLRYPSTCLTSTGSGAIVYNKAIIPDDTQLWKFVEQNGGLLMVNKATGEYVNTDLLTSTSLNTSSTAPAKTVAIHTATAQLDKVYAFLIESTDNPVTFRATYGDVNSNYALRNYTGDQTLSYWMFMDYSAIVRQALSDELEVSKAFKAICKSGTLPGQFLASDVSAYNTTFDSVQTVCNDKTLNSDDYIAAKAALKNANAKIKRQVILPKISTSDENTVWYILSGTRPATTQLIYNASTDSVKYQPIQQTDNELWRFVPNGSGYALQNKATMKYMACDSVNFASLITQTALPTTALKIHITSEFAMGTLRFLIQSDTTAAQPVSYLLHASPSSPDNYLGATTYCGWLILEQADMTRALLKADTASARSLYLNSELALGTGYGLYSKNAHNALGQTLSDISTKDIDTMDFSQLVSSYNAIKSAYSTLLASRGTDWTQLTSTADNPNWLVITGCDLRVQSSLGKRVGFDLNGKLVTVAPNNADSSQVWRFEVNPDNLTIRMINQKSNGETLFGTIYNQQASSVVSGTGTPITLGLSTSGAPGVCFELRTTDLYQGYMYPSGTTLGAQWAPWLTSSDMVYSWKVETLSSLPSAIRNTTVNKYHVRNTNGVISVDGITNFQVYSIMGQLMNNKASLCKGVYIVKVGNQTQKYILR